MRPKIVIREICFCIDTVAISGEKASTNFQCGVFKKHFLGIVPKKKILKIHKNKLISGAAALGQKAF
jgi:hypothetical protein